MIESMGSAVEYVKMAVQVIFLAWVGYRFYRAVFQTKAQQIIRIAVIYAITYGICILADLDVVAWVLKIALVPIWMFLCTIYQPEIRRSFSQMWSNHGRLFRLGGQTTTAEQIESVLSACDVLVTKKRGALIVFPRRLGIKNIVDSGTRLDADISTSLILTVFDHDTPLHDGAMIIEDGRITAAGCYLPLSEQTDIRKSFGTRHRAALGLAEESDAVVIVVSEETQAVSVAYNANLYYDLDDPTIKRLLLALFSYHDVTPEELQQEVSGGQTE